MVLTTNEKLLKTYEYGSVKLRGGIKKQTLPCTLTITNKRIVSGDTQIAMNEVAGVSASVNRMFYTILAPLLLVAAFVCLYFGIRNIESSTAITLFVATAVLIVFSILCFIPKRKVTIKIFAKAVTVLDMVNLDGISRKKSLQVIKIKVNQEAEYMVNEIGDLIAEYSKVYNN